ncbi:MAG: hypothetical protein ABC527_06650 [Candidatus Methanosuratincola petrocarbonis]
MASSSAQHSPNSLYHAGFKYCALCADWYPGTLRFCPVHGRFLRSNPFKRRRR